MHERIAFALLMPFAVSGALAQTQPAGEVLYRFQTGGVFGGGVGTYELGGKQYVVAATGNTSFHPYKAGGAPTIIVFGL